MQSTRESLLSILVRARERISAFEIELRCAQWASMPGPVHSETAHELRGGLNAIVLQVGAIKLSSECDSQDLAREIEALERDLRRLKLALKQCLEHDAPATRIEEAFG